MCLIAMFWMYVIPASKLAGLSVPGAWFLGSVMLYWRVPDEFIADTYAGQLNRTNTGIISPVKLNNF
jgi:hypothetical protein